MKDNEIKIDFTTLYGNQELTFKNVSIEEHRGNYYTPMKGVSSVIRQFVKQVFPEVGKFQISSKSYAGGDSISIYLAGVERDKFFEIDTALKQTFERGNFNGMIDMYEYKEDYGIRTTYNDKVVKFSTKYTFTQNRPKYGTKAREKFNEERKQVA